MIETATQIEFAVTDI